ncbi:TPA: fimbrial-like protein YadL [Escherichia coli]|nr:fimbrial-like protein YadL [Escherichia coli]
MKSKTLCYGLPAGVFFAASLFTSQLFAATDSVKLNVKATVETGTCAASLVDDNDQPISVIAFGDAYIPEIDAKTKIKIFKLQFKDCAGIPNKKALVKLTKRATCEGAANDGPGFANGSAAADKANAVAVEVWNTTTPGTDGKTQFSCVTPVAQEVNISTATGTTSVYHPMSARLVVEKNKSKTDITAGPFSAPATFSITYN